MLKGEESFWYTVHTDVSTAGPRYQTKLMFTSLPLQQITSQPGVTTIFATYSILHGSVYAVYPFHVIRL